MAGVSRSTSPISTKGADLLRGLAILMVVAYHAFGPQYGFYIPWNGWARDPGAAPSQAVVWFYPITLGWAGVALFFVISGFCIHYSYLRSGRFDARRFFWRRFWRIYPAYIVALAAFTAVARLDPTTPDGARLFASHALFFHNFSEQDFFAINASFWSIATEIQLYLLYPFLLMMRSRLGLPWCLAVLFLVGCGWRLASVAVWGLPDHLIHWAWSGPLMTWFDWGLGALVAERFHGGRRTFSRPGAWLIALIPLFAVSTLYKPLTMFTFTLAAGISAVALDLSLQMQWRISLGMRLLAFIGTVSYSLYLWHQPLLFPMSRALTPLVGWTLAWVAVVPLLILLSWCSYSLLERPGINLGERLWPSASRRGKIPIK